MKESTQLDALVADMLGDIGKMHDLIKALPEALEESLTPTVGALISAGKNYETTLIEATNELVKAARIAVKHDATQARNEAMGDIKTAAREAVNIPIVELVNDLKVAVARVKSHREDIRKNSIIAGAVSGIVSAILVAILVFVGLRYSSDSPTENTAQVTAHKKGK